SGVPPDDMFKYLSKAKEFGDFATENGRIYRHITFTGKDVVSSIKEIANRTPSEKFKNFLDGFVATIMSGSDINRYLSEESRKSVYEYEGRQEKYTDIMSFFADLFIVGFMIVPLVFIIILSVFSMIGPTFFNLDILLLLKLITYVFVPLTGIIFLVVLNKIKI
ncbi:MAG: type II secretion system F family protein, partial [Candidatus Aenigmarchaeota archaeon]|nr:type II secretion system F family protein [Candidatus Aenigmarchaeota archaeon]